jgi:hypothetical protein
MKLFGKDGLKGTKQAHAAMQRIITAKSMQAHATPSMIFMEKEDPSCSWTANPHRLPPVRKEFISTVPLTTSTLEQIDIKRQFIREPVMIHDKVALGTVKCLRFIADSFFRDRYIHRAIVLETVAAVPGMVAGMVRHLRSLRLMVLIHCVCLFL